jgi:hypothetical protein
MRILLIAIAMLLYTTIDANAQISVGLQTHGVSIGFNVSSYPRMVAIPGYPVYYDPRMDSNYFFYDGLYWVYQDDNWYSSAWYDGPWDLIGPEDVPLFVLRVPVRYYRHRPSYFSGWSLSLAPRWGEHWGHDWEQRRSGWDKWDRHSVPRAAPLPSYQSQYSGSRYPRAAEQQYSIRSTRYHYQPREAVTRQYFQQHAVPGGSRTQTRTPTQTSPQAGAQERTRPQAQQRTQGQGQAPKQRTQPKAQAPDQQKQAREEAQAQQKQRTEGQGKAQQQRKQAQDQAQAQQQQQRAQDHVQVQQKRQVQEQGKVQQQQRAQDQAQAQQKQRAQEQGKAQQQRAQDQAQAQQKQRVQNQGQQKQEKHVQDQAHQQQAVPHGSAPNKQADQQQQRAKPTQKDKGSERKAPQKDKEDQGGGGSGNSW